MGIVNRTFSVALISSIFIAPSFAVADPHNHKRGTPRTGSMLGGAFLESSRSPVAYIETDNFTCSGTLVAPTKILTAAHCIGGPAENYAVLVAGNWYSVNEIGQHQSYDQEGTTEASNSKFDVGMITLSAAVTNVPPIPIANASPLAPGLRGTVYGFGTNQYSSDSQPKNFGKTGRVVVSSVAEGMFETDAWDTGVTVCSGDSGGPVIAVINSFPSVIGVVSTSGSGDEPDGTCTEGDGTSQFVDIQSESSLEFLAQYPDAQESTGTFAFLKSQSAAFAKQATSASKQKDVKKIKKLAKAIAEKIGGLRPYTDGRREGLLNKAITALNKAASSKKKADAAKQAKSAASNLGSLAK